MTTFYSDEMTKILAVPKVALSPVEHHGKIRIAKVTYLQVAEGTNLDVIELCKLPAGRVRLIGRLSNLYINLASDSQLIDIGWKAYVGLDGVAVNASLVGLDDALDVDTVGTFLIGSVTLVAKGGNYLFESQEGVIITMSCDIKPLANDTIDGFIAYVLD